MTVYSAFETKKQEIVWGFFALSLIKTEKVFIPGEVKIKVKGGLSETRISMSASISMKKYPVSASKSLVPTSAALSFLFWSLAIQRIGFSSTRYSSTARLFLYRIIFWKWSEKAPNFSKVASTRWRIKEYSALAVLSTPQIQLPILPATRRQMALFSSRTALDCRNHPKI